MDWVEKESGGRIKFKRYVEGVLSSPPEQIKFIRNGAIDLGPVIITRFTDLPLTYLPVLQIAGESEDVVYRFSRMVNIEHPGSSAILQKEWEEKNIKFIGDGGIYYSIMMSSSGVMTKDFSFTSLADLKGKKIGSGSAQPELKGTGIVVVNVQRPDMYEALARGLVDGMMILLTIDIITTKFFNMPIPGVTEIVEDLNIPLVFMAAELSISLYGPLPYLQH